MTDWMWVYENPKEAAAEIDRLRALLQQTRNYIDKDHYGMLAEIDAALAVTNGIRETDG
jgi:hypothetical protein